jgi:hypothetical protein
LVHTRSPAESAAMRPPPDPTRTAVGRAGGSDTPAPSSRPPGPPVAPAGDTGVARLVPRSGSLRRSFFYLQQVLGFARRYSGGMPEPLPHRGRRAAPGCPARLNVPPGPGAARRGPARPRPGGRRPSG